VTAAVPRDLDGVHTEVVVFAAQEAGDAAVADAHHGVLLLLLLRVVLVVEVLEGLGVGDLALRNTVARRRTTIGHNQQLAEKSTVVGEQSTAITRNHRE